MVKKGFSLVEAMVAAVILAVVLVFALASTTKRVKEPEPNFRGYYTCRCGINPNESALGVHARSFYVINGAIRNDTDDDGSLAGDTCTFYPTDGINLYTVKVWNAYDDQSYNIDRSREFVVTSFSKREVNVKLGNNSDPDISVEGAFYLNDLRSNNQCYSDEQEDDCTGANKTWRDKCVIDDITNEAACVAPDGSGLTYTWYDTSNNNICTDGVNVEIMW